MNNNDKWTLKSLQEFGGEYLVGGVSSSFRNNPYTKLPMYLSRAEGATLTDVSGKKYIDFFMGHGAMLLGHKRPEVEKAVRSVLDNGFQAEFDSELTIELAKMITEIIPSAELVRFTNSGSESTMLAMRLARGYTGKDKIIRIDGHFHGVHDYVLFNNLATKIDSENNGTRTSNINSFSAGIPKAVSDTITLMPWNNIELFADIVKKDGDNIAGIIFNPIDYNNGLVTTTTEYLAAINEIAHENNIVVIYDEILSGFRTGIECAQGYYGVTPDISTLGKAISNGVPTSVIAGKKEIMSKILEPGLPVIHGGTFSGNLFGTAASIAAINIMKEKDFYPNLFKVADYFYDGLQTLFDDKGIPTQVQHLGSGFFPYIGIDEPVVDYHQFTRVDWDFTNKFFSRCIEEGLYFHTDFTVSAAHTKNDIDVALSTMARILEKMDKY